MQASPQTYNFYHQKYLLYFIIDLHSNAITKYNFKGNDDFIAHLEYLM